MGTKSELKVLIVFVITGVINWHGTNAQRTNSQEFRDGVIMVHTIGSAALNFEYYFHVLGIACENRDQGFWKIIDQNHRDCISFNQGYIGSQRGFQTASGSMNKVCMNWKMARKCKSNLALDLDRCLGSRKGSDALSFVDAYAGYTCGDLQDTNTHLSNRPLLNSYSVPGVFKCFDKLQDRILDCVKSDRTSISFCSRFNTVEGCFGRYYTDYSCIDPPSIFYMQDLFRSMSGYLGCDQFKSNQINHNQNQNRPYPEYPVMSNQPLHNDGSLLKKDNWGHQDLRRIPIKPTNPPALYRVRWNEDRYRTTVSPVGGSFGHDTQVKFYGYETTTANVYKPKLRAWNLPKKSFYDPISFGPLPTKIPDYNNLFPSSTDSIPINYQKGRHYREDTLGTQKPRPSQDIIQFRTSTLIPTKKPMIIIDDQSNIPLVINDRKNDTRKYKNDDKSTRHNFFLNVSPTDARPNRLKFISSTIPPIVITSLPFQFQETTTARRRMFRKIRKTTSTTTTESTTNTF